MERSRRFCGRKCYDDDPSCASSLTTLNFLSHGLFLKYEITCPSTSRPWRTFFDRFICRGSIKRFLSFIYSWRISYVCEKDNGKGVFRLRKLLNYHWLWANVFFNSTDGVSTRERTVVVVSNSISSHHIPNKGVPKNHHANHLTTCYFFKGSVVTPVLF